MPSSSVWLKPTQRFQQKFPRVQRGGWDQKGDLLWSSEVWTKPEELPVFRKSWGSISTTPKLIWRHLCSRCLVIEDHQREHMFLTECVDPDKHLQIKNIYVRQQKYVCSRELCKHCAKKEFFPNDSTAFNHHEVEGCFHLSQRCHPKRKMRWWLFESFVCLKTIFVPIKCQELFRIQHWIDRQKSCFHGVCILLGKRGSGQMDSKISILWEVISAKRKSEQRKEMESDVGCGIGYTRSLWEGDIGGEARMQAGMNLVVSGYER